MTIKTVSRTLMILAALFYFCSSHAWSSESGTPTGCLDSGFKQDGGEIVLNPGTADKQGLFLLHNVTGETFQVTHPVSNGTASAGWTSEIGPGRWSAFAAGSEDFALVCVKPENGETKTLPCEEALKVCELPNPKMPADLSGSFWVSEDKELNALLEDVKSRGISWGFQQR